MDQKSLIIIITLLFALLLATVTFTVRQRLRKYGALHQWKWQLSDELLKLQNATTQAGISLLSMERDVVVQQYSVTDTEPYEASGEFLRSLGRLHEEHEQLQVHIQQVVERVSDTERGRLWHVWSIIWPWSYRTFYNDTKPIVALIKQWESHHKQAEHALAHLRAGSERAAQLYRSISVECIQKTKLFQQFQISGLQGDELSQGCLTITRLQNELKSISPLFQASSSNTFQQPSKDAVMDAVIRLRGIERELKEWALRLKAWQAEVDDLRVAVKSAKESITVTAIHRAALPISLAIDDLDTTLLQSRRQAAQLFTNLRSTNVAQLHTFTQHFNAAATGFGELSKRFQFLKAQWLQLGVLIRANREAIQQIEQRMVQAELTEIALLEWPRSKPWLDQLQNKAAIIGQPNRRRQWQELSTDIDASQELNSQALTLALSVEFTLAQQAELIALLVNLQVTSEPNWFDRAKQIEHRTARYQTDIWELSADILTMLNDAASLPKEAQVLEQDRLRINQLYRFARISERVVAGVIRELQTFLAAVNTLIVRLDRIETTLDELLKREAKATEDIADLRTHISTSLQNIHARLEYFASVDTYKIRWSTSYECWAQLFVREEALQIAESDPILPQLLAYLTQAHNLQVDTNACLTSVEQIIAVREEILAHIRTSNRITVSSWQQEVRDLQKESNNYAAENWPGERQRSLQWEADHIINRRAATLTEYPAEQFYDEAAILMMVMAFKTTVQEADDIDQRKQRIAHRLSWLQKIETELRQQVDEVRRLISREISLYVGASPSFVTMKYKAQMDLLREEAIDHKQNLNERDRGIIEDKQQQIAEWQTKCIDIGIQLISDISREFERLDTYILNIRRRIFSAFDNEEVKQIKLSADLPNELQKIVNRYYELMNCKLQTVPESVTSHYQLQVLVDNLETLLLKREEFYRLRDELDMLFHLLEYDRHRQSLLHQLKELSELETRHWPPVQTELSKLQRNDVQLRNKANSIFEAPDNLTVRSTALHELNQQIIDLTSSVRDNIAKAGEQQQQITLVENDIGESISQLEELRRLIAINTPFYIKVSGFLSEISEEIDEIKKIHLHSRLDFYVVLSKLNNLLQRSKEYVEKARILSTRGGEPQVGTKATHKEGPIGHRYALLIGINGYEDGYYRRLNYCINDVIALGDTLKQAGYEVILLHDNQVDKELRPTRENILMFLHEYCERVQDNPLDLLWIHFSCHGVNYQEQPYLVAQNTRKRVIVQSGIPISYVEATMRNTLCQRLILTFDSCHIGNGLGRGSDEYDNFINNVFQLANGFAFIAASGADEVALETDTYKMGVFTYFLIDGIHHRNADRTHKGLITVNDISLHVVHNMKEWAIKNRINYQKPLTRIEGRGDIVLVDYRLNNE